MKFSSSLFVLSSLCLFANSQDSSYPGCISTACASLQKIGNTTCDYDLAKDYASVDQTKCICKQPGIQIPIQQCFNCLQLSSDPTEASYFGNICSPLDTTSDPVSPSKSTSVTPSGLTTPAGTATGSVTLTSQTTSTDTASMPSSSAQSTTSGSSSSGRPSIDIPRETPTSTGAGSHITPVIGLAAVLLVAQVGL